MPNTTLLPPDAGSARLARDVVRRVCAEEDVARDDADTAVLLTSELVANAVLHAGGASVLTTSVRLGRLSVAVTDRSTRPPRVRRPRPSTTDSGRGLVLVQKLADRWGHTPTRTGKTVWFELRVA
jgi:anti-sigma regulatory factor (Ser/Thr protein kinase)